MYEILNLAEIIKALSKLRTEILQEIEKLPKEQIDLVSKFTLISNTLVQLQHQFDDLVQK